MPRNVALDHGRGFEGWKSVSAAYERWLAVSEVEAESHPWEQYLTKRDLDRWDKDPVFRGAVTTKKT